MKTKLRILIVVLILLNIMLGYTAIRRTEREVVNLENFTDYYTESEAEGGGYKLIASNFNVYEQHYTIVTEKAKKHAETRPLVMTYTVKSGDTLSGIASKFGQTQMVLKYNNKNIGKYLKIGQKLKITRGNSITYKVAKGDSLSKIASRYQKTVTGLKKDNNLTKNSVRIGQTLIINNPKVDLSRVKKPSQGFSVYWPVKWAGVTSVYGRRYHPVLKRWIGHLGVDLRARYVPVKAAEAGTVTYSGWMSGYGNIIIIKHAHGYETRYGHLQTKKVAKGQKVRRGQLIGISGKTGRVTGPHLHFEIRKFGTPLNPMNFFK